MKFLWSLHVFFVNTLNNVRKHRSVPELRSWLVIWDHTVLPPTVPLDAKWQVSRLVISDFVPPPLLCLSSAALDCLPSATKLEHLYGTVCKNASLLHLRYRVSVFRTRHVFLCFLPHHLTADNACSVTPCHFGHLNGCVTLRYMYKWTHRS